MPNAKFVSLESFAGHMIRLENAKVLCSAGGMTQSDPKLLLRRSWAEAIADKRSLGLLFYSKLFQLEPKTEALFKEDMDAQAKKLIATLSFIIDSLDEEDALLDAAADLAVRHVAYNVTADQYALVGQALLDTLRELLGTKFDPATEAAWAETYTGLSQHMISSAYG